MSTFSPLCSPTADGLNLLFELVNLCVYEGDGTLVFHGKNVTGKESAERLNRWQERGLARPTNNKMKRSGFYQLKVSGNPVELEDLREVCVERRLLMGPNRQPLSLLYIKPKDETRPSSEDDDCDIHPYANDSGNIFNGGSLLERESHHHG